MPLASQVHIDGPMGGGKKMEKDYHIVQEGDKWRLVSKSTGKVLGEHPSKDKAEEQERAIQAQKNMTFETERLDRVFIFKEGTWNGDKYSSNDLDGIVETFHETKSALKPYMKFGHGDDTLPALGWVENVYRLGNSLYADISNIPKKIADLMRAGAYKRVSPEIFMNLNLSGKKFNKALKAVGLLGGETPAVAVDENFINTDKLYKEQWLQAAFASKAVILTYEIDPIGATTEDIVEKELEAKVGSLESQVGELTKKLSESEARVSKLADAAEATGKDRDQAKKDLAALTDKFSVAQTELSTERESRRLDVINGKLDKLIADQRILPAQREALFAILKNAGENKVAKFKVGDKDYDSQESLILSFVEAGAKVGLPTKEASVNGAPQGQDLVSKAKTYAAEHKVSFKTALLAVAPRD